MFAAQKTIKITDFNNICRTCLHNIDLKPFEDYVLIETLEKIADITFVENDELPQNICAICVKKILEIRAFSMQCKEIDFVLKKCLNNAKKATQHLDNIQIEPILIKEELDTEQVKSRNDNIELYKEHKHFLAMETEESSSNDSSNQHFIPKVNYHRNLLKTSLDSTNQSTSNMATSETSDEDPPTTQQSILKEMLKDKQTESAIDDEKETSDLTYECGLCLKQFTQINQFIMHQTEHNDRTTTTASNAQQKETKQNIIKNEKFQCLICFKTFKDGSYLIRHGRVHGNRPYKCDQCDKSYIESGHLVVHKRTHTGERPFVCESCPKAFVSLSNLVKHRVVHTGIRKIFTCDICGKEMNDPSNLRKHRRVHTKEKPFKCKYCETAFSGASDLRAHERLHTGERPYACDMCNRKFSRSTYLTKHKKTCVELMRIKNEGTMVQVPPPPTEFVGTEIDVDAEAQIETSIIDISETSDAIE